MYLQSLRFASEMFWQSKCLHISLQSKWGQSELDLTNFLHLVKISWLVYKVPNKQSQSSKFI